MIDFKVFDNQLGINFQNSKVRGVIRNKQMYGAHYGYRIEVDNRNLSGVTSGNLYLEITYKGEDCPICFYVSGNYISLQERNRKVESTEEFLNWMSKQGYDEDTVMFISDAFKDLSEQLEERNLIKNVT